MSQTVRGVISRRKGEPVELVDVVIPDPGPGEVVVDVIACGVCHTDLTYREGGINDEYPFLLGHEAAGTVESVGAGVTNVEPGDFVILNWRAVCGQCRACKRGRPWYCFDTFNAAQAMTLTDGTPLTPALGIGAFADKTLVHEGQCTKVDPAADPAVAGLLGCGVMAGLGAAINTGAVSRDDTVAVIGCGGVGDAADGVTQPHPKQSGHLIISGTACAQPAAEFGADTVDEAALECTVHVLVAGQGPEAAVLDVSGQAVQAGEQAVALFLGEQSCPEEHPGMGFGRHDVVGCQYPVEVRRLAQRGKRIRRSVGEPATPQRAFVGAHRYFPARSLRADRLEDSPCTCTNPLAEDWSNVSPSS